MVEEKARSLLPRHHFANLSYYIAEYGARGMTIEAFVSVLLEMLDTPEKVSVVAEASSKAGWKAILLLIATARCHLPFHHTQHTLVTEIRELIFPEDRTRYDELVYRRGRDVYGDPLDRHRVSSISVPSKRPEALTSTVSAHTVSNTTAKRRSFTSFTRYTGKSVQKRDTFFPLLLLQNSVL